MILDLLDISPRFPRDVTPPKFIAIPDNGSDESFKHELVLIPHHKVRRFTVVLNTKIGFPPSINHFINVMVPLELVMNINYEILVRSHFLYKFIYLDSYAPESY